MKYTRDAVRATLGPLDQWAHKCHQASLALVKSGVVPGARVARGFCQGVGVHSWVAIGDPYDPKVKIIDPTLWSWVDHVDGVWFGSAEQGLHTPQQAGNIWSWGKPSHGGGETIELTPTFELSRAAQDFLDLIEPLDYHGWGILTHAPVEGWPAGEIFAAMDDTSAVGALVPIDLIGMLTDRNPGGLYLG